MLWTTVCDLTFQEYKSNLVLDSTDFHNNAKIKGSITSNPKYVSFKNPNDQLVVLVKDESLQRFKIFYIVCLTNPRDLPFTIHYPLEEHYRLTNLIRMAVF